MRADIPYAAGENRRNTKHGSNLLRDTEL